MISPYVEEAAKRAAVIPSGAHLLRKVQWAERKCAEAAASDEPWALANLRLYQNYLVRFLGEYHRTLALG